MSDDRAMRHRDDQISHRYEQNFNIFVEKRIKNRNQNDRTKENSIDTKNDIEENCKESTRHKRKTKFAKKHIDCTMSF